MTTSRVANHLFRGTLGDSNESLEGPILLLQKPQLGLHVVVVVVGAVRVAEFKKKVIKAQQEGRTGTIQI